MDRPEYAPTPIPGLVLIKSSIFSDQRGSLTRLFCDLELREVGWSADIKQVNLSITQSTATVRGMHFQVWPHAEDKIVTCLTGAVFDVAVDLRRRSLTFLHWHSEVLSSENRRSLLIPKGFAHGFQALCDGVQLLYFHSAHYSPDSERGLRPTDPSLGIKWPLPISLLSARDGAHPLLTPDFAGLEP